MKEVAHVGQTVVGKEAEALVFLFVEAWVVEEEVAEVVAVCHQAWEVVVICHPVYVSGCRLC